VEHLQFDHVGNSAATRFVLDRLAQSRRTLFHVANRGNYDRSQMVELARLGEFNMLHPNTAQYTNLIVVDCDHPLVSNEVTVWDKVGLRPNYIVIDPTSRRGHLHFWLSRPVRHEVYPNPAAKMEKWLADIVPAMTDMLGGDRAFNQKDFTKNPLSPRWETVFLTDRCWSLGEITEILDKFGPRRGIKAKFKRQGQDGDPTNRNTTLFNTLRHRAMRHWWHSRGADVSIWHDYLLQQAVEIHAQIVLGNPKGPLPKTEIQSVAKSVANWIVNKYTGGNGKRRGVMHLDPTNPLEMRQILGAQYTARIRRESTSTRIGQARNEFPAYSQTEIAGHLGVSLSTVKRHWNSVSSNSPTAPADIRTSSWKPAARSTVRTTAAVRPTTLEEAVEMGRRNLPAGVVDGRNLSSNVVTQQTLGMARRDKPDGNLDSLMAMASRIRIVARRGSNSVPPSDTQVHTSVDFPDVHQMTPAERPDPDDEPKPAMTTRGTPAEPSVDSGTRW
jgi:hypothetical protein